MIERGCRLIQDSPIIPNGYSTSSPVEFRTRLLNRIPCLSAVDPATRGLNDKLYEKRKTAALDLEKYVQELYRDYYSGTLLILVR